MNNLLAQHQSKLRSFIRGRVADPDDADDILQDVWFQFLRTLNVTAQPIDNISAWLFRVARNRIINLGIKKREQMLPPGYEADGGSDVVKELLRGEARAQLEAALAELPREQRVVFELTEFEHIPVKKIAEVAGIPVATLNSRKHYAVMHLRRRLKGLYEEMVRE